MKKIVVLLFVLLFAATIYAADLTVGPKMGVGISWFSGDDWDSLIDTADNSGKMTFSIGGFCNIGLSNEFSIQPEINLLFAGGGAEETISGTEIEIEASFKALEIPVLFKYDLGGFSLFAGPDIFFILGDMDGEIKVDGSKWEDFSGEPDSRLDFGLTLGADYKIDMGQGALDLGLNYSRSFTGIGSDDKIEINIIRAVLGYGFSI